MCVLCGNQNNRCQGGGQNNGDTGCCCHHNQLNPYHSNTPPIAATHILTILATITATFATSVIFYAKEQSPHAPLYISLTVTSTHYYHEQPPQPPPSPPPPNRRNRGRCARYAQQLQRFQRIQGGSCSSAPPLFLPCCTLDVHRPKYIYIHMHTFIYIYKYICIYVYML